MGQGPAIGLIIQRSASYNSSPRLVAYKSPDVQTVAISVGVGTACTLYEPLVVLEALALTASITISLTLYTFWAARKGLTFQKWGPMLFTCAPSGRSRTCACVKLWSLFV